MSIRKLILEAPREFSWIEDWLRSNGYQFEIENVETGVGSIAVVYGIKGEDKVIRIETEAMDSMKREWESLVGENFDHVVEVYLVRILENSRTLIVVMENLESLDHFYLEPNEEDLVHAMGEVVQSFGANNLDYLLDRLVNNIDSFSHWFRSEILYDTSLIYQMVEENDELRDLLEQVLEGIEELDSIGIGYYDLHLGNIMKDPKTGKYKLVDIA